MRLILTDVLRTGLVGRAVEITREIFDCLDVKACCSLSVVTTLEFLEHHFAKVGHRSSSYDPPYLLHGSTADTRHAQASAAKRFVQTGFGEIGRERHSAAPHFSQADLWPGIISS